MTRDWGVQVAGFLAPLDAGLGIILGAICGLTARLARRLPRLGYTIALVLLFAFASEAGRNFAAGLLTHGGFMLRYYFVPWSISDDQIVITAMQFGSLVGGVIAGLSMHVGSRGRNAQTRA